MKTHLLLILIGSVWTYANVVPRVMNGSNAKDAQFPYLVSLRIFLSNDTSSSLCGGTILSKRWILTAAHCVGDPNISLVIVKAGTVNLTSNEAPGSIRMKLQRKHIILHPRFKNAVKYDIALLKLPKSLTFSKLIQPAKLPKAGDEDVYAGRSAASAGWGLNNNKRVSRILQYINVRVISNSRCSRDWNNQQRGYKIILPSYICVDAHPLALPCSGDSGGPLVVMEKRKPTVVGVVSHGIDSTCEVQASDIFTRVSSYVPWLEKYTGRS